MSKRWIAGLTTFLIVVLSLVSFGCSYPEQTTTSTTTVPVSTVSAEEILASTISNASNVNTAKYDMSMDMGLEITGGNDPGTFTAAVQGSSLIDNTSKQLKVAMTASVAVPNLGDQQITQEMYIIDGWLYQKTTLPQLGEQWTKKVLPQQTWESQNQMLQQLALLKSAVKPELLGSENIDGTDCYKLQITPDLNTLLNWALAQQQQDLGSELQNMDLSKMVKSLSFVEWIAKDTFLPVQTSIDLGLEILPSDFGTTPGPGDPTQLTMNLNGVLKFYDYNIPVVIELPPAAADAREITQ